MVNPGQHQVVDHQGLWHYRAMYHQYGFADNWLWYAQIVQRTFTPGPDSGVKWASCKNEEFGTWPPPDHEFPAGNDGRATGLCADHIVPPSQQTHTLLDSFKQHPVTLDVFGFAGAFIVRACGNFSVAPTVNPIPTISGTKYRDVNRNGQRDAGEPGLAGWQMKLVRDSSDLAPGQSAGHVMTATTAADGTYSFALWGQGPGNYHVEEVQQDGFVQTAAPASVRVPFGAGSANYGGRDFGNVENSADVMKLDWDVVSPPSRIDAGVPTTLRVRAVIANAGPAPEVDIVDAATAQAPADCLILPGRQAVARRLREDESVILDFDFTVTCEDPSNHAFVFGNTLALSSGVTDPDETNNARSTSITIPVFDDSDARLTAPALDCPAREDVATTFTCTGTANLANVGPYGTTNTDVVFLLTPPSDCVIDGGPARSVQDTAVASGSVVPVTATWTLQCASRSYHPMSMTATAALDHIHVEDHEPANDVVTASDTVEVFEAADLSIVEPMRIACGGRLPSITSFPCAVRVTVHNAGPATAVATSTTTTLTAPADCVTTPVATALPATLDPGESETLTYQFTVVCSRAALHTLLATATITAAEPHAEDRHPANNTSQVRWVPTDVKPRSEPSSVNASKEGVVPVSILSTPEFDAFADVDRATLRWGVTGFEASLVGCGGEAEDTNGDGLLDLVCRFDTKIAQLTCAATSAILTGVLRDGTAFESNDPVNVTGCKK